ncbi:BlaI/MecI/CopY family transcriptional regulator [Paenibacillus residui]|uniref:BlaI/MecI/CopY family transcriptional regulator n=1 Tax=Paenibacillus residui TaxID=629724 RepID=A0ABW3D5A7_9BACL
MISRISSSEWEIMKNLWNAKKPLTANEIIQSLKVQTNWSPKTVRTLIGRLVQKNVIGIDHTGPSYKYYPLVTEEEGTKLETHSFLAKMRGISIKPILVHFLDEQKLSKEDIMELKNLLEKKEEE